MEPSLLQGYNKFMQEVIIQGICYHHLTFDPLNSYLLDFNKEAYEAVCDFLLRHACNKRDQVLWELNMSGQ